CFSTGAGVPGWLLAVLRRRLRGCGVTSVEIERVGRGLFVLGRKDAGGRDYKSR
ncbi:MAG: hypothetical protein HY660_10245, partial [Armatimonadetes bacterium]|nr:hypothetical protein [Armatimonadota bacterium]